MLRPLLLIAAITIPLLVVACGSPSADGGRTPVSPKSNPEAVAPAAAIASLAETGDQIVAELPLGSSDGIQAGDLLRVYAADAPERLKGMLQVTEVAAGKRCLARLVGLQDRNAPLAVGDRARVVRDLSSLGRSREVETAAKREQAAIDAAQSGERREFENLRQHYQRELAALRTAHEAELARAEERRKQDLATQQAAHDRETARLRAERDSDLAALRATLAAEARSAVREAGRESEERLRTLTAERDRLAAQSEGLVQAQLKLQARVQELVAEQAVATRKQRDELAAEAETREALQARMRELEARLAGREAPATPVLTADPKRSETILQRLERTAGERDLAVTRNRELARDLEAEQATHAKTRAQLDEVGRRLAALEAQDADRAKLARDLATAQTALTTARADAEALELHRLRAERAYYDLAHRLLRLPRDHAGALADLQQQVRDQASGGKAADEPAPPAATTERH